MHFEVLGLKRNGLCGIEVVKSDVITLQRKPTKIFEFRDPESFIRTLIGHNSVVVYVGKVPSKEGEKASEEESWKAYYFEPTFDHARKEWGIAENILPHGSLAILHMDGEYDLEWALEDQQKTSRRWIDLWHALTNLVRKISRISEDSKYADEDRFRYLSVEELAKVVKEAEAEHQTLTSRTQAEV